MRDITNHWLKAVRGDVSVPSTGAIDEPLLLDSVPSVLGEILRVIESNDSKIDHAAISNAARQGRARARQNFAVKELVREYQLLRESIFLYLQEHSAELAARDAGEMLTTYRRVGSAVDEAMRETISAFVEEHTEHLRHLSRTDSLTGLYNHRTFYERLDEELRRASRYGNSLSLALIDLDDFKGVNDTNGHPFGDHLLVKCAECLRCELRTTDIICRYGGDEFGILLPETNGEEARVLVRRLQERCAALGAKEGAPASFGMSFGVAAHPEDDGTVSQLVQVADERLLQNKARNKSVQIAANRG